MITSTTLPDLEAKQGWVVFSGQTDLCWLRFLKPGYRHCYILLNDGRHWISIDPLSSHTEIIVHHVSPDFDLPSWLAARGYEVVFTSIKRNSNPTLTNFALFTCVEAVKRIIGLRSWRILTPWQLFKHLSYNPDLKEIKNGRINLRSQTTAPAANHICSSGYTGNSN